jgi:hypothetical protein
MRPQAAALQTPPEPSTPAPATSRRTLARGGARDVEPVGEDPATGLIAARDVPADIVAGLQRRIPVHGPAGALEDQKRATGRSGPAEYHGRLGGPVADELLVDAGRDGRVRSTR